MARNEQVTHKRKVLGFEAKTNVLKYLLADPETARDYFDVLNPEDIANWQPGYAVAWRHFRDSVTSGSTPSKAFLLQSVREAAEQSRDEIPDDVLAESIELIRSAYKLTKTDDLKEKTIRNVKRMVDEQIYLNVQADFEGGHVPADIPDFFVKLQERVSRAAPATTLQDGDVFKGDWWKTIKVARRSTHVKVYDRICGGGVAGGWVVGFAAPFGAGKTALVTEAACEIVKNEKPINGKRPVVAIFTFETPRSEYLLRFLSCYAMIDSRHLQEVGYEGLSGPKDEVHKYQKELERTLGKLPSERKRARDAVAAMQGNIILHDVSNMESENMSIKSIPTIANCVRQLYTDSTYVHSVWIDHTSAVVDHMIATSEGQYSHDDRTELIRTLPQELRKQVAKKFDVPVVLLAQLSGAANARSPAAPMGGTDVEGCKSFGMYLDVNVVSGRGMVTGDNQNGLRAWYSDKNRHGPIVPKLIVRFNGQFYQFTDATDQWMIDDATRSFMLVRDASKAGLNPGKYVPTVKTTQTVKTETKRTNITL